MLRLIKLVLVVVGLSVPRAHAQDIPYHLDPSARELTQNLAPIPAIRFLTTADFPPFNYRDETGELIGFNIDLARDICSTLKVACTIQAWPWEQAASALADSQGDALIAGLALTVENGEKFDFSTVYLMLPGRFVTKTADAAAFDAYTLDGKVISVRRGATHDEFMQRYLPGASRLEFATEVEALQAVADGRAYAYFGDALRASFWLNDNISCCAFAGDPYFRPDLFGAGLAIALPAGRDDVRQSIDWALARLKRDGTTDELYLRWFPISFY